MSNEEVIQEIEDEIKKAKGEPEEFQIEITEDPAEEAKDVAEEAVEEKKADPEPEYGEKVQKRIKKLVDQRREAEVQARQIQEQNAQLSARLERLEQGSKKSSENQFNQRYAQTKAALTKAVEEGDTEAQVNFQEQWQICVPQCGSQKCRNSNAHNRRHRQLWAGRNRLHKIQHQRRQ